jgi:hypothetical protein
MLDQWRTPTGWVFIYKPGALKGEIAVSSSNFTVEPGINCGKGMLQSAITRAQANEIGAVCASLAHK